MLNVENISGDQFPVPPVPPPMPIPYLSRQVSSDVSKNISIFGKLAVHLTFSILNTPLTP